VPEFVTLTPLGIDKAVGVQSVAGDVLRSSEHIVAIGDGENDLSLFGLATVKVSIGGGSPRLVELADVVAPTVHEDGFAWSVHNVVLPLMQARL
jgi:haloacid dehalogenase-like hydrolase